MPLPGFRSHMPLGAAPGPRLKLGPVFVASGGVITPPGAAAIVGAASEKAGVQGAVPRGVSKMNGPNLKQHKIPLMYRQRSAFMFVCLSSKPKHTQQSHLYQLHQKPDWRDWTHTHIHPPKRLAHPRSLIPPLSTLTLRATHAHPTSPRSTGLCAIWGCISSSSSSDHLSSSRTLTRAFKCRGWSARHVVDDKKAVHGEPQHAQREHRASIARAVAINGICMLVKVF